MFNVVNKISACALLAIGAIGCSSQKSQEQLSAEELLIQAQQCMDADNYAGACELLDSLQKTYPAQKDAQRQAIIMRPVAMEGLTIQELEQTDSLMALASWRVDSLSKFFTTVSDAKLVEPYRVAKTVKNPIFGRTGLEARLNEKGEFYLISGLSGASTRHNSVVISAGGESAATQPVAYDGAMNYRSGSNESVTYYGAKAADVAEFCVNHDNRKLTIEFRGERKPFKTSLPAGEVHAIADSYRLSKAIAEKLELFKKTQLLNARLQVARDQKARTAPLPDSNQ